MTIYTHFGVFNRSIEVLFQLVNRFPLFHREFFFIVTLLDPRIKTFFGHRRQSDRLCEMKRREGLSITTILNQFELKPMNDDVRQSGRHSCRV